MPLSAAKRALIAASVLACIFVASAALVIHRWRRPLPAANAGATPDLLSLLPADAPAVAYIDVATLRKLRQSPLAAILGLAGENPQQDRDYQQFVRDTGFDYTRDLDKAAIAFWPSNSLATPQAAADNRTVAIADGRFDENKIKAYALRTGKTIASGGRSLYVVPGDPVVAFEFFSPTRIALASGPDAENALPVSAPAPRDPGMQFRLNRVAGAPIFAVARTDNLPPSFYDGLRSMPQFESIARSVQALLLAGQPEGDVIHAALDAECDSMSNAAELSTMIDGLRLLGSMALVDPKTRAEMTQQQLAFVRALLNQAKLTHQDRWVRLTLDITPAMLGEPSAQARARSSPGATLSQRTVALK